MGAALLLVAAQGAAEARAAAPSIISEAVSYVTEDDATLEAHINTEQLEHGAWYQFQLASEPGEYASELACAPPLHISLCLGLLLHEGALSIGFVATGSPDQLVTLDLAVGGGLTGVAVKLKPGTIYHYRVIAANALPSTDTIDWEPPTVFGPDQTFKTAAAVPSIESESVSHVTSSDATLEAHIKTEGLRFGAWYQFQVDEFPSEIECPPLARIFPADGCGPGPQVQTAPPIGFVSGGSPDRLASLDLARSGMILQPETTYSYRVLAAPSAPPGDTIQWVPPPAAGPIQTFTTPPAPSPPGVSTAGAFATGPTTATVDGSAEPKGESTTVHADYARAGEPWCTSHGAEGSPAETEPQSIGSINGVISEIVVKLEGLAPRREYCAELVAHNESGTAFGGQVRFTTPKKASSCSGSLASPGVLAGTYRSNVTIGGACMVKGGPAVVDGNLTVSPGAVLVAAFANSNLTVRGNLMVQRGAVLILGCGTSPDFPCLDNEEGSSEGSVSGNLSEQQPLGVVVHATTIGGNVQESGGGGGFSCSVKGPTVDGFYVFGGGAFGGFPVYSDYSGGSTVHGNLGVVGLSSCYLGVAGVHVRGNVNLVNNQLADPDAAEIIGNQISGNLVCQRNSQVWDSFEETPGSEPPFPRILERNTVSGNRVGQCVIAGPVTEGGPPAGGPF